MNLRHSTLTMAFVAAAVTAPAQTFNPKPVRELGNPRLIATSANPLAVDSLNPNWVEGRELYNPTAIALDNSTSPPAVYIADTTNNRVLGWKYASQLSNGAQADVVLGQKDFFTTGAQGPGNGLSTGLTSPSGLAVDKAGNVYIADTGNNRILRFPKPFLQQNGSQFPDLVLGQAGFNSASANPQGVQASSLSLNTGSFPEHVGLTFDTAGNLFVTDYGNNRVLRYPASALSSGQNGPNADIVVGQLSFTANTQQADRINKTGLNRPVALAFDAGGRLFVSDSLTRVLVYLAPLPATGAVATRIMGIPTATTAVPKPPPITDSGFGFINGISMLNGHPVLVDASANRVLVFDTYDTWPAESTAFSPTATVVVGQSTFLLAQPNEGLSSAQNFTLSTPFDVATAGNDMWVVDTGNQRVLVFPVSGTKPGINASRVIGQVGFNLTSPNLIEGKEFFLNSGTGATGSIVIDRNATPPHLYVADTGNNRVLGFYDYTHVKAGQTADLVIGQNSMFQALVNAPTNDPAKPSQNSLHLPTGLALDSAGNLFVADTGNGRVLRFPQPFAQNAARAMPNADLVIGQSDFTAQVTDPTNRTMRAPLGVALASDGSLLVSDFALNRVTFYNKPLSNGMLANKVLGQSDFNTLPGSTATTDPAKFNSPRGIALDPQDRVYVCDTGSGRIAIFDTVGNLPSTLPAPAFSLKTNLSRPGWIAMGPAGTPYAGQFWVADFNQNAALHFPVFTTLLQNSNPDNSVPAVSPLSAAFDNFGGIAVADNANRIITFAPQLSISNAANFTSGPMAPGTIVSIFPAAAAGGTTAPLANATASFDSLPNPLPLPTTLANVQVMINNQPAPLFYVGPGQINLPLPTNLPTSGTATVQVVDAASGQIYGLTDLALAAVSPGLFTLNASGSGALAAINEDGNVNGPDHGLVRGHAITFFGTGEGIVPGAPPDGSPATTATTTPDQPQVIIGGITLDPEDILYSGLAPGFVGVWQINVIVPQTVTAGNQIPVIVSLDSVSANPNQLRTTISLR